MRLLTTIIRHRHRQGCNPGNSMAASSTCLVTSSCAVSSSLWLPRYLHFLSSMIPSRVIDGDGMLTDAKRARTGAHSGLTRPNPPDVA